MRTRRGQINQHESGKSAGHSNSSPSDWLRHHCCKLVQDMFSKWEWGGDCTRGRICDTIASLSGTLTGLIWRCLDPWVPEQDCPCMRSQVCSEFQAQVEELALEGSGSMEENRELLFLERASAAVLYRPALCSHGKLLHKIQDSEEMHQQCLEKCGCEEPLQQPCCLHESICSYNASGGPTVQQQSQLAPVPWLKYAWTACQLASHSTWNHPWSREKVLQLMSLMHPMLLLW